MGHRPVEESNQSSVLFSLKELMGLQETRVEEERHASALEETRRADAERLARAEAARHAEQARAEEEARMADEARRLREEAARHDALRLAEVERARVAALGEARAIEQRLAHEHQARMLEIQRDVDRKKLRRNVAVLAVGSVVALAAGLGVYFGKVRPEAMAERDRIQAEADRLNAENAQLARDNADAERRLEVLGKERDGRERVPPPVEAPTAKPSPRVVGPLPTATPIVVPPPCKKDHDPLNPCL